MSWSETKYLKEHIVKKIQYGTVTIPGNQTVETATISEVNPDKTMLIHLGSVSGTSGNNGDSRYWDSRLTLVDSVTISATRIVSPGYVANTNYCLIEFY